MLELHIVFSFFFFFNDTATTEIYTLSLHDALPIYVRLVQLLRQPQKLGVRDVARGDRHRAAAVDHVGGRDASDHLGRHELRSEEHTSELQSRSDLVCRLLLEKKKKKNTSCHSSQFI